MTMASFIEADQVLEKIGSIDPQTIGDFGAQMLPTPRKYQEATSFVISHVAYQILTDVFEVAAGTGFNFNAMSLTLKQVQKQIEELAKKVDILLKADMETAKSRIWHGMNYVKRKETFPLAYDEFKEVLSLAEKAYPKVEAFEDKVFCKQLAIFSRVMISTYDPDTRQFVALYNLPEAKKRVIADSVLHDVESVNQQFKAIEIPWSKTLFGKSKKEKEKNQNILDSLLKRCLPVIWNYQDIFKGTNEDEINMFVPEGEDDAAAVTLKPGVKVLMWKQMIDTNTFKFQWYPCLGFPLGDPSMFPIFNCDTCSLKVNELITYEYRSDCVIGGNYFALFSNLRDYFKDLWSKNEHKENPCPHFHEAITCKDITVVRFHNYNDTKYLNVFSESTIINFSGYWDADLISRMKSKEEFINEVNKMPEVIRRNAMDDSGMLIVHKLLYLNWWWCDMEVIELILNKKNSLTKVGEEDWTALHFACQTGDLEIVKMVIKIGEYNEVMDKIEIDPCDYPDQPNIRDFLNAIKNGSSVTIE